MFSSMEIQERACVGAQATEAHRPFVPLCASELCAAVRQRTNDNSLVFNENRVRFAM
jgi:hypothetical protein